MFRELHEEVGLDKEDVEVIGSTKRWLKYKLPKQYLRHGSEPLVIGQKQKWFLMRFLGDDTDINIKTEEPEFMDWRWVSADELPDIIVPFKRKLYQEVLETFSAYLRPAKNPMR